MIFSRISNENEHHLTGSEFEADQKSFSPTLFKRIKPNRKNKNEG